MRKFTALLLFAAFAVCLQAAELPVDLGAASTFTVLGASTVTSTGPTIVYGDVGLSPGSAVVGFPPASVAPGTGAIHINDSAAVAAQAALTVAYLDAAGRSTAPVTVAGNLGGQTLAPGLYKSTSSLMIAVGETLTLDGQGDASSVFIFQMASTLKALSGSRVRLIGGALASNVFWQVGSSATLGTGSIFNGTILAQDSITLNTGAALNGRALARTAAVTLDTNTMINPGPPNTGGPPAALAVTCPLGAAQIGVPYNSLLAATGGTPPYTYSTIGSLPQGLSLSPPTGFIVGSPTGVAGTTSFSAHAQDAAAGTASRSCSITTSAPSGPLPIPAPSSVILVAIGLACAALYVGRERILRHLR